MPRPQTKTDLIQAATENYEKLIKMIDAMTEKELTTEYDFSADEKKKEAHWKRDKNLRDVLIHLHEWHKLMIEAVEANDRGEEHTFLPEEYSWRTYGDMNIAFWESHQKTTLEEAKQMLASSHAKVMELIDLFSNEELFTKGIYKWAGDNAIGSYFVSTTSSHYDWAMKKIKAHKKQISYK